jgi:hypothetical protein
MLLPQLDEIEALRVDRPTKSLTPLMDALAKVENDPYLKAMSLRSEAEREELIESLDISFEHKMILNTADLTLLKAAVVEEATQKAIAEGREPSNVICWALVRVDDPS